eukprot:m.20047 g.20047  ORF g.20047 m.20047 type:complete len:109 (+) comp3798_c0_seq2:97-423(+)
MRDDDIPEGVYDEDDDWDADDFGGLITNPHKRHYRRHLILAVFLMLVGIVCTIMGIVEETVDIDGPRSAVYFVAAAVSLIPGAYFTYYFVQAHRKQQGYRLRHHPSLN